MMVQAQEEMGEGLANPTDPNRIPTIIQPSMYQPQKKQKPRKIKRKDTELPQISGRTTNIADEAINEEMNESLERAATTASNFEAKQDSGNINKTNKRVLDLENTKTTQAIEIESIKRRVKKLENNQRSRTHKLKRLYTARVESSDDNEDLEQNDIQEKIDVDYLLAQRLQEEEQQELTDAEKATLFMQFLEKRRKFFAAKAAGEKRNKPPTQAQQRKIACTYLKNMEGKKLKDLKNKSFDYIQKMFDKAFKRVNTFEPISSELVEESSKKAEAEVMEGISKRVGTELEQKREDVETLWKLVKDKHGSTRPEGDYERVLWGRIVNIKRLLDDLEVTAVKIFLQEDMDSDYANMIAATKVPMLKPENGHTLLKTQVVEGVTTLMPITSVEEKAYKRLEVKARTLVSCDGLGGYDWSGQAKEAPNYALMAYTSTSLESIEERLKFFKTNESAYLEDIKLLKDEIKMKDIAIKELRRKLEVAQKEKEGIQLTVEKLENASKSLNKFIDCQIVDNCKKRLGYESYNAIPPPYTGNFMPPKHDLSYIGLDKFAVKPVVENKSSKEETKAVRKNPDAPIIEYWVLDDEEENDKGVIDSGCSRHMKRNMSHLIDYEEIDGGYVAFRGNPKGGKITGKADRRNGTLIETTRTMLADSKLPTAFWAEAVNTTCYVQNRMLVVKPHNKTPYELFHSKTSALSFMKPFGCPVTILNTLDYLGKFNGKADEGFFVRYLMNSKAFRVFNSRKRIVEENLHIRFSENTPNAVEVKNASTPMETQKPLLKDEDGKEVDVYMYRSMIGSLMYLTYSRYLKGQPKFGLWYPKDSPFDLVAYTDSDYAGTSLDRKSIIGEYNGSCLAFKDLVTLDKSKTTMIETLIEYTKDYAESSQ
nr:retrovirus-related Pol polyprotein from transposon TNT 1-94 [Tanacetum cinerariifolium]